MVGIWRVSATEVKNSWGRVVQRILKHKEPALVENKGKPMVVILPVDEYEKLIRNQDIETYKQHQLMLVDEAERFAKDTATRYTDQSLIDSVDILREMREERDNELLGLR